MPTDVAVRLINSLPAHTHRESLSGLESSSLLALQSNLLLHPSVPTVSCTLETLAPPRLFQSLVLKLALDALLIRHYLVRSLTHRYKDLVPIDESWPFHCVRYRPYLALPYLLGLVITWSFPFRSLR